MKRLSWRRIAVVIIVSVLTAVYIFGVVHGRIPKDHRLGTSELLILVLAVFGILLIARPDFVERLSRVEVQGVKIELEQVKTRQVAQESELRSLRLILPLLLPDTELAHLRNLASGGGVGYTGSETLRQELRHLRSIGLISNRAARSVKELTTAKIFTLSDYFELTESGREWLDRIANMERRSAGLGLANYSVDDTLRSS